MVGCILSSGVDPYSNRDRDYAFFSSQSSPKSELPRGFIGLLHPLVQYCLSKNSVD